MPTDPEFPALLAVPRPGILKALGIANIVFATLNTVCIFSMSLWFLMATTYSSAETEVKVVVHGPATKPGVPMTAALNPMMGMDDKHFVRFSLVESGVNLLINGLMFATGIGLLNLRRWAARGWGALAWTKIVLAVLLWGYYIVAVAPGFSEHMARSVSAMFAQQGVARGRPPSVADLTRVYSIMNLIVAVGAIVVTSIYPAISVWLLSRPGIKAAIVDKPGVELELP